MKKILFTTAAGIAFAIAASASALATTTTPMTFDGIDPTPFRLQTYTGVGSDTVVIWFTGSPCQYGNLSFPSAVASEKNRYWNTILLAKLTKKKMIFFFDLTKDDAGAPLSCVINSYAIKEE